MLNEFIADIKKLYDDILKGKAVDITVIKSKWGENNSLGEIYQKLYKKELKKETGSFYTPIEVVDYMTDEILRNINYKQNLYIKIADPSCGGGYFLTVMFNKLLSYAKELKLQNPEDHIIKNNLWGFDIDENAAMITVIELYEKSGCVSRNIKCMDFLTEKNSGFDVIMGNPPYMGHKVINKEYRDKIQSIYGDVFSDKADISYCFIKKSIESLYTGGILAFFTSRYIIEALNAKGIRKYLKSACNLEKIMDFYGVRVVKGAGIDNIIVIASKDKSIGDIEYFQLKPEAKDKGFEVFGDIIEKSGRYSKYIRMKKNLLEDEGWIFLNDIEWNVLNKIKGVELGILCDSFQGIITGCDDAFVMSQDDIIKEEIEEDIIKPWIKGRNINKFKVTQGENLYLIYSNNIQDELKYKNSLKHIGEFKERLKNRRECKSGTRRWFDLQWGRDEYVFKEKKIVYPYKASSNRFAIDSQNYFSADVYALKIKAMFEKSLSYEFLAGILNSRIYEFYIKAIAKKLGDNLYEYYPNKILNLRIPDYISDIDYAVKKGDPNCIDIIDRILIDKFNITDSEYQEVIKWSI